MIEPMFTKYQAVFDSTILSNKKQPLYFQFLGSIINIHFHAPAVFGLMFRIYNSLYFGLKTVLLFKNFSWSLALAAFLQDEQVSKLQLLTVPFSATFYKKKLISQIFGRFYSDMPIMASKICKRRSKSVPHRGVMKWS